MAMKSISDIEKEYDLELARAVSEIKKLKKKNCKVLLQFPDGLKIYSPAIVEELERKLPDANFVIWMGTCFGACDVPKSDADLIIQFGHAQWK